MGIKRKHWTYVLIAGTAVAAFVALMQSQDFNGEAQELSNNKITADAVALSLESLQRGNPLPDNVTITHRGQAIPAKVTYTLDNEAQEYVESTLKQWGPDYAAFVAMDATSGRIIALASFQKNSTNKLGHMALRATYPAASVFKVITATAVIESRSFSASSVIPFTGSNHTLYRKNVFAKTENRWTRYMTLKDAFAKSVNSVFGKIGAFHVGAQTLKQYAERFMFNKRLQADFPVPMGGGVFEEDDPWHLVEVASGFTRLTTLNPVQGAMIAASVINDGVMMTPSLVDTVTTEKGDVLYRSTPLLASVTMSEQTAQHLRQLMRETTISGTSARAFRSIVRKRVFSDIEVGGKTGSLTGTDPSGKYDWYVGYAKSDDQKIAVAALTINQEKWRVKSAQLASDFVIRYFQQFAKAASHSGQTVGKSVRN
jgi:peptidoglycan glycosyltransferase